MHHRLRILLVDDSDMFRAGLARAIRERDDLELVGVARGGREGLEKIEELGPDLALVDLRMPDLGGLDVCRAAAGEGTRIVLLTGSRTPAVRAEAAACGADACLSKALPWPDILELAIATARQLH